MKSRILIPIAALFLLSGCYSLAADITLEDMRYSLAGSYRSRLFKDMVMERTWSRCVL